MCVCVCVCITVCSVCFPEGVDLLCFESYIIYLDLKKMMLYFLYFFSVGLHVVIWC